jgi:hypothetical protein
MPSSRAEDFQKVQEFIEVQGVTVQEPFEEGQARKKWLLREDDRDRATAKERAGGR